TQADAFSDRLRFAPNNQDPARRAAQCFERGEYGLRAHRVGVGGRLAPSGRFGFDQVDGAWSPASRGRVDQDSRIVIAVEQFVREVKTADAEVFDRHSVWKSFRGEAAGCFDAEAVVTEKNVADTCDQYPAHGYIELSLA